MSAGDVYMDAEHRLQEALEVVARQIASTTISDNTICRIVPLARDLTIIAEARRALALKELAPVPCLCRVAPIGAE